MDQKLVWRAEDMAFKGFKRTEIIKKLTAYATKKEIDADISKIADSALKPWNNNENIERN